MLLDGGELGALVRLLSCWWLAHLCTGSNAFCMTLCSYLLLLLLYPLPTLIMCISFALHSWLFFFAVVKQSSLLLWHLLKWEEKNTYCKTEIIGFLFWVVDFWGVGAQKFENVNEWINSQRKDKDVCIVCRHFKRKYIWKEKNLQTIIN